jgi:molybdate transport system substrate-binding protein
LAGEERSVKRQRTRPARGAGIRAWTAAALLGAIAALADAAPPASAGAVASGAATNGQPAHPLVIFAAASLTDAVGEIARAFAARTAQGSRESSRELAKERSREGSKEAAKKGSKEGSKELAVRTSFAASSVLAKQIEAGAPADVFLSADPEWMDYLEKRGLLKAGTREDLLMNRLVLIAPSDSRVHLTLAPHADLTAALGGGRLATGDPDSVPVGRYAQAALKWLGAWESVAPRLVRAENVRAALEYVARGEATLGIVYGTDALAEKRVRVVDVFPADSHPPIIYHVALTSEARQEAAALEAFFEGEAAREIFARHGFERLPLRTSRSGSP